MKKIFPAAALALLFFASALVFVSCSSDSDDDDSSSSSNSDDNSSSSSAISEESTTVGFYSASKGDVLFYDDDGHTHYYHFTSATEGVRNRDATSTSTGNEKSFTYSSSTGTLVVDDEEFEQCLVTHGGKIYLTAPMKNSGSGLFSTFTQSGDYGTKKLVLSKDGGFSFSDSVKESDDTYYSVEANGTFTNASGVISVTANVTISGKHKDEEISESETNAEWIMFYCGDYLYDVDETLTVVDE